MAKKKTPEAALKVGVLMNEEGVVTGVTTSAGMTSYGAGAKAAKPSNDTRSSDRFAPFGDGDGLCKLILDKLEKAHIAAEAVDKSAKALMGQKVVYYRNADLANGVTEAAHDPEIDAFLKRNAVRFGHISGKAYDMSTFSNGYCQHIFNITRTKIVQLKHLEGQFCRVSKYSEVKKTFDRKHLFYSSEFSRTVKDSDFQDPSKVTTFDLYDEDDPYFLANLIKAKKATFATQTRPRTSRSLYYALPKHAGLYVDGGWVDGVIKVPEVVNAMMDNEISLRYVFYFTVKYFYDRFGQEQWLKWTTDEQREKFDEVGKEMETKLVGTKNGYSSLRLMCDLDFQGNLLKTVFIEPMDDKAKSNSWVPTSDHGDKQIVLGHGLPPSMFELSNSNVRMNTSSGSANREGFNNVVTLNTPDQLLLLADLQLMADFNAANGFANWDVTFAIADISHTTTNKQENGLQNNSDNPPKPAEK